MSTKSLETIRLHTRANIVARRDRKVQFGYDSMKCQMCWKISEEISAIKIKYIGLHKCG